MRGGIKLEELYLHGNENKGVQAYRVVPQEQPDSDNPAPPIALTEKAKRLGNRLRQQIHAPEQQVPPPSKK